MSIITGSNINKFRAKVLLSGLKLEIAGMKKHGRSCYAIIKEEFGFRGNKQKVYKQFEAHLKEQHP